MFFPENYRLYKHNKQGRDSSGRSCASINLCCRPNVFVDAYLYGYPLGRKKRFRSPQEYFPHFLWLMEGKSENYGDCACKNCAGDWVHKVEPLPGRGGFVPAMKDLYPIKRDSMSLKKEPMPTKRDVPSPKVVVQQRFPSQGNVLSKPSTKSPSAAAPAAALPRPPPQPAMLGTPLPATKAKEQELDAQYHRYTYRIGELVWFNRGTAWGLALVIRRDTVRDPSQSDIARARYLVQPLSHPFSHPEPKLMSSAESLRPWLAWSAPGPTHRSLANKTYASVEWKGVLAGQYGPGDAEVDGSIFAAKQIDDSLTLISPLTNNTLTTGERTYLAMFLGGEKLYVGEPARLRIHNGQDVLIIHQIIEKLKPNSTNINLASVQVVGDIYRYTTVPYDPANAKLIANPHLPARMKADLDFRNNVTISSKRLHSYWKLLQQSARLPVADLKGRWYESSILLPILRTNAIFASDIQKGEITDVGDWINGRGDANGAAGKMGTRFRERLEAVGRAVPAGLKLGGPDDSGEGGIEDTAPPARSGSVSGASASGSAQTSANSAPRKEQAQRQEQRPAQGQERMSKVLIGESDLSQFMDMDKMQE